MRSEICQTSTENKFEGKRMKTRERRGGDQNHQWIFIFCGVSKEYWIPLPIVRQILLIGQFYTMVSEIRLSVHTRYTQIHDLNKSQKGLLSAQYLILSIGLLSSEMSKLLLLTEMS